LGFLLVTISLIKENICTWTTGSLSYAGLTLQYFILKEIGITGK